MEMDYDPLVEAVCCSEEDFIPEWLIDDPAVCKDDALLFAVTEGRRENIINLLLQHGARADLLGVDRAVLKYDEKIVEKLVQSMRGKKEYFYFGDPLFTASSMCREASSKICEVLIKYGADVNRESGEDRCTPLGIAVNRSNDEVVEVLLQYGAQPCREMAFEVPLEFCFSLKASTIESMIKYAALQVNTTDEREVQKFYQYITNSLTSEGDPVPNMGKKYMKFAQDCMKEAQTLREKILNEERVTLFNFVISQGDELETYKRNDALKNSIVDCLTSTPFPIFREVILIKLEKNMVIRKLIDSPCPVIHKASAPGPSRAHSASGEKPNTNKYKPHFRQFFNSDSFPDFF